MQIVLWRSCQSCAIAHRAALQRSVFNMIVGHAVHQRALLGKPSRVSPSSDDDLQEKIRILHASQAEEVRSCEEAVEGKVRRSRSKYESMILRKYKDSYERFCEVEHGKDAKGRGRAMLPLEMKWSQRRVA